MIGRVLVTGVLIILSEDFLTSVNGLRCLQCNGVSQISNCQEILCHDGQEQCYLERVLTPDMHAVFNAGCTPKLVCDSIISFGKRSLSKRHITVCAQCCNTPPDAHTHIPCNGNLCHQGIGQTVPVTLENTCAVCDRINDYNSCAVSEVCLSNEVCSIKALISGTSLLYELGCEQKTVCDHILRQYRATHKPPFGRADHGDTELCAACCTGRNCNKANCFELIKNQTCIEPNTCGP